MTSDVLAKLEAAGAAQNRKVYARHGVTNEMFGVSYAELGKLAKQIKTNHSLAEELWATNNHDAMVLATKIADPAKLTAKQAEAWAKTLGNYVIADAFAGLVARSPHACAKLEKWATSKDEWVSSAGWTILCHAAMYDTSLPDGYFDPLIKTIESSIHARPNRTRHAMVMALISIGIRNDALQKKVVAAARRIGRVHVDHGDTGCKTPNVEQYIARTLAHRAKKKSS
ncbi:MAG: DNA alkylation repair protein [Candidatus Hydrogenedentes bacterium]|nr:DNA alkylation repair protein [Candidatus Hydrogenedentota bacterium]